jgi:hypothetical protein
MSDSNQTQQQDLTDDEMLLANAQLAGLASVPNTDNDKTED